ncbi:hypothetical protein [Jeotgalibacillus malaysiensis]|uniref:hypothetical protein n=1 Tax=Jeotgalibacillus malaysiensis TaxID=1508404 RepID=UPI00384F3F6B
MKQSYQVVSISDQLLITRDCNVINLFWMLWKYGNSLDYLYTKGRIPLQNLKVIKFLRIVQLNIKYFRSSPFNIEIPLSNLENSVIIKLKDRSYKCIDLQNKKITCVSKENQVKTDYLYKLRNLKYDETPKIYYIVDNSSYSEEYLNLIPLKHQLNKWNLQKYNIYKGLDSISKGSQNKKVNASDYAKDLTNQISSTLINIDIDTLKEDKINKISQKIADKIGDTSIVLNFSHGDAWVGNIMLDDNRIRLIDWHDFGFRSRYFDHITLIHSIVKIRISNKGWESQGVDELNGELQMLSEATSCDVKVLQDYHFVFMLEMIINRLGYYEEISSDAVNIAFNWVNRFEEILN